MNQEFYLLSGHDAIGNMRSTKAIYQASNTRFRCIGKTTSKNNIIEMLQAEYISP